MKKNKLLLIMFCLLGSLMGASTYLITKADIKTALSSIAINLALIYILNYYKSKVSRYVVCKIYYAALKKENQRDYLFMASGAIIYFNTVYYERAKKLSMFISSGLLLVYVHYYLIFGVALTVLCYFFTGLLRKNSYKIEEKYTNLYISEIRPVINDFTNINETKNIRDTIKNYISSWRKIRKTEKLTFACLCFINKAQELLILACCFIMFIISTEKITVLIILIFNVPVIFNEKGWHFYHGKYAYEKLNKEGII